MGNTPMIAPDGSSGEIPNASVPAAIKAGGKVGAWMLDPQGNRGVIPLDRSIDAIQAGARPAEPLPDVQMHSANDRYAGLEGKPMLGTPISPAGAAASLPRAAIGIAGGYGAGKISDQFTNNPWIHDAAVMVGSILAESGASAAKGAYNAVKNTTLETPDKISLPGGFKLNRNVPPDPEDVEYAQTKQLTEAHEAALSDNAKFDKAAQANQAKLEAQAAQAKSDLDTMYENRGKSIMMQNAYQDKLDSAQTKAENMLARSQRQAQMNQGTDMSAEIEYNKNLSRQATEAALENRQRMELANQAEDAKLQAAHESFAKQFEQVQSQRMQDITSRAKLNDQWGSALNRRGGTPSGGVDNPAGNPTPFNSPESNPQDLISRTKKIVVPGDAPSAEDLKRAGDFTQVPTVKLSQLARFGDELAKNELIRRLKQ